MATNNTIGNSWLFSSTIYGIVLPEVNNGKRG